LSQLDFKRAGLADTCHFVLVWTTTISSAKSDKLPGTYEVPGLSQYSLCAVLVDNNTIVPAKLPPYDYVIPNLVGNPNKIPTSVGMGQGL
jgi:hypothetical protein